jgi:transposase
MRAIFLEKNRKTYNLLKSLKKKTEKDKAFNVARRIHAIMLNMDGNTAPEIAGILGVSRCQVSEWIRKFSKGGIDFLLEGIRSGRPSKMSFNQLNLFTEMLRKGPEKCGYSCKAWTYALIQEMIHKEFGVSYHPSHLRKLLHIMNFSLRDTKRKNNVLSKKQKKKWEEKWYPDTRKMRWLQKPL